MIKSYMKIDQINLDDDILWLYGITVKQPIGEIEVGEAYENGHFHLLTGLLVLNKLDPKDQSFETAGRFQCTMNFRATPH